MSSIYTKPIKDGKITFKEFILRCAKGLSDNELHRPFHDFPLPEKYTPKDITSEISIAERQITEIEALSDTQVNEIAENEYITAIKGIQEKEKEIEELRLKYGLMLAKAKTWVPPSPEYEGLQQVMVDELTKALKTDCNAQEAPTKPEKLTGHQWRVKEIERRQDEIKRLKEDHETECKKVDDVNLWLAVLRASLNKPRTRYDMLLKSDSAC